MTRHPEWTAADFKNAIHLDGVSIAEAVKAVRRGRGLQKEPKKVAISILLNPDIVKHFKSGGAGWQSRMEVVLEKARGGAEGVTLSLHPSLSLLGEGWDKCTATVIHRNSKHHSYR